MALTMRVSVLKGGEDACLDAFPIAFSHIGTGGFSIDELFECASGGKEVLFGLCPIADVFGLVGSV